MTNLSLRSSGILLPISSLPGPYGIGTMGKSAFTFVDFLAKSKQRYWQILPIGPISYGDSPYQSFSSFAGNPYYIDLDLLVDQGLLLSEECQSVSWESQKDQVDYALLYSHRYAVLRKAFARFKDMDALSAFCEKEEAWAEDYALFMALKEAHGSRSWLEWEPALKRRDSSALRTAKEDHKEGIAFHIFMQYLFFQQWNSLKSYANQQGIGIIGDIPIYVALDSADVWTHPEVFQLNEAGDPTEVAGVPPDAFSITGQLWGNPLYNWDYLKSTNYAWWVDRLKGLTKLYDITRIDHFRGFESYYAIPYGDSTAEHGRWRMGPGISFFRSVEKQLGSLPLIAEDLGYLTEDVTQMLVDSGYPGMKVLQFAFDSREESDYLPHNYSKNSVVYTGTHDNDTVRGWYDTAPIEDVAFAKKYLYCPEVEKGSWAFIRAAWASVSGTAIAPLQDFLNLGSAARINTPSTIGGNWMWRLSAEKDLFTTLATNIASLTQTYGRAE